jgi:hypothetical protein
MKKSELLNGLQEEYQNWKALLDQIGPARMDLPGVTGHWSIKDIVAHLTGWRRRTVARLQAAQRGEPEPPHPGQQTYKPTMKSMHGSMSPIMSARWAKSWMNRIKYFSSSSLPLKVYPIKS